MATYYRWKKNNAVWSAVSTGLTLTSFTNGTTIKILSSQPPISSSGYFQFYSGTSVTLSTSNPTYTLPKGTWVSTSGSNLVASACYAQSQATLTKSNSFNGFTSSPGLNDYDAEQIAGSFISYVYSTSASSYPTNGVQSGFYYNNRTTITSPVAPTGLTYPNPIVTSSATVSWTASVTNVPIYAVSTYEVSYSTNGGSTWTVAGTTASTSLSVTLPTGTTSIQFRVRAQDSNGQWSSYATGTASTVLLSPTLTVPSMAMQGQQITVNWTAVDGATSYTLQRQANTDDGWVQVYSGNALTFTETVGTWTTVQYQVQAVFSSGAGGWATSDSIPVVSAAALVISGQDEDLGLITHDVPYTVSTDTGNSISLTRTVNGVQVASLTVENGFAYDIPVMDLPTGEGTIVISASVNTSSGAPVTATRTWTYTKTACIFPNVGSTAQLTLQGENIFPPTLAECVRVGANLGGDLGHALEMIAPFILNGAKIETGSYVGTGTYGADNPNTLTFLFEPKIWCIYGREDDNEYVPFTKFVVFPWGYVNPITGINGSNLLYMAYSGNTVSFYGEDVVSQYNYAGYVYYYFAIG